MAKEFLYEKVGESVYIGGQWLLEVAEGVYGLAIARITAEGLYFKTVTKIHLYIVLLGGFLE